MKSYLITKAQLQAIESGLTLANYFIQDNASGFMIEQWEKRRANISQRCNGV